jgi:hypothetical protein
MNLPKIKGQGPSIITELYAVLLCNFNGACFGVIKIGHHQAKLKYQIKLLCKLD